MSLSKRIGFVVSLLLLLLLGSLLGLYFIKAKSFFEERLATHAKEIVHTLNLSIRSDLGDLNRTRELIDAAFATGDYTLIKLYDLEKRNLVYMKRRKESFANVPPWFVRFFPISPAHAEEAIENGQNTFLRLQVVTDRGTIYRQLYELFLYTALLFLVFGLVGLVVINLVVKMALHPLAHIKHQAEEVIHNHFVIQKEIPSAPEFRQVVLAMNSMVKRVKELYTRSVEAMQQIQDLNYKDPTTGLFNRRYFQLKFPEYLLSNDSRARGVLTIIRLNGIAEGNKKIGHKRMDEFLYRFAATLKETVAPVHEPLLCRINGTEFALMLPTFNLLRAEEIARGISGKLLILSEQYRIESTIYPSIGICEYERKMPPGKLLRCVDTALADAALLSESNIVAVEPSEDRHTLFAGKEEWREILETSLKEGRLKPYFSPVYDIKSDKEIAWHLTFDIHLDERIVKSGDYLPAVVELGMEYEFMQYQLEYMRTHNFTQRAVAFDLIAEILEQSDRLFLFEKSVKEIADNLAGPLFVEIPEYDITSLKPIVAERVSITLKEYGIRFGINHFSGEGGEYGYLKYVAPAYVKMSESSYLDLDTTSKNVLQTLLGSLDIELIVVNVHAQNIPELQASSIRYIMYEA